MTHRRLAGLVWLACGSACFDPAERLEIPPESSCPASALSRKARAPARPQVPAADAGKDDDGDGALATKVLFAVIGDYGLDGQNEARVADLVTSWNPDFVITTGDNNYFQGAASTIDQNIGKYYCQFIGNYLGKPGEGSLTNRFWPTPGNHDWLTQELRPYLDYFTLPGNERYYDVARGLVHLYALDSDWNELDGVSEIRPGQLAARSAGGVDGLLRRRVFPPPPVFIGAARLVVTKCGGPSKLGAPMR